MEKTWNEIIVEAIKYKGLPIRRRDIDEYIKKKGHYIPYMSLGVYLNTAKRDGVIAHIKIPPAKVGYYCSPEWLDEQGNLLEPYKIKPYWDESNTNKSTGVSNLRGSMGRNK